MEGSTLTEIYEILDQGTEVIKHEMNLAYLDALAEMGEILFQGNSTHEFSQSTKRRLTDLLESYKELTEVTKEELRKAFQLAVLKGMKAATQAHHAMTPDAVSLFMGYLVNKVGRLNTDNDTPVVMDPAVGSGNLLTAVMNQMASKAHGIGAEADETLLRLSYVNANLQKHSIDLFHQDSVATPLVKNVDVILSDLPIGFYPNDSIAEKYELKAKTGHSYVHHLLIEQSINHSKEGGFLFLLVPNFLFESEEAKELHKYIKKEAIIYSFLQLPKTMFKNSQWGKSILILRKKAEGIYEPRQALLAELPSFSNERALADMMSRISTWFDELKE
ncbi:class I SAM-dependent methyltransferase [Evansella sp. AB-rgal1]|uniref:class I SAM-dependent methyltransferase n=1 Tax=Evansella sp. AB-rgal1 TaxID=3242696 RepID=UPI00359D4C00